MDSRSCLPMSESPASPLLPEDPEAQRLALLSLLRGEPGRGGERRRAEVLKLVEALERSSPADLGAKGALEQLEGVWELRWSSSRQPYLQVGAWLENLQLLQPSQGRAMNLLRLAGPLGPLASIVVEAAVTLDPPASDPDNSQAQQRLQVRFRRGGWLGPQLAGFRPQLLCGVQQSFPAWLDITVLDDELRLCRGNAGTIFALLLRADLRLEELMLPA
jgi:hypothetical protein